MDLMNSILSAVNAQAAYDQQQSMSMALSIAIGFCGGLSVAILGLVKRQGWMGTLGFMICLIGGYLGGWILVIPLTGGIGALINELAKKRDDRELSTNNASQWPQSPQEQIQQNQPVRRQRSRHPRHNISRLTSHLVAANWNEIIEAPSIHLEDLPSKVRIVTTPVVTLRQGVYKDSAVLLGDTPLEISADGNRHLLSGYIGSLEVVTITIDAAEPPVTEIPFPQALEIKVPESTNAPLIERIERLATLRANGTLTEAEFSAAKAQLLNNGTTAMAD